MVDSMPVLIAAGSRHMTTGCLAGTMQHKLPCCDCSSRLLYCSPWPCVVCSVSAGCAGADACVYILPRGTSQSLTIQAPMRQQHRNHLGRQLALNPVFVHSSGHGTRVLAVLQPAALCVVLCLAVFCTCTSADVLQGVCSNRDCPYLHVKVAADAPACRAFLQGYCPAGASCAQKHLTYRMLKQQHKQQQKKMMLKAGQRHTDRAAAASAGPGVTGKVQEKGTVAAVRAAGHREVDGVSAVEGSGSTSLAWALEHLLPEAEADVE